MSQSEKTPISTALHDLHVSQGGRMVDFAGYNLPVQFEGIVKEHMQTRASASLFDVSHMGQVTVTGPDFNTTINALESLFPGNLKNLKPGGMRYTVLLNKQGGIEDDLIVTRPAEGQASDGTMFIVVNAARKDHDLALMQSALGDILQFKLHDDKALLALQGPLAATVLATLCDAPHQLSFMNSMPAQIGGIDCQISRCGYTGEDGFEISVANNKAPELAKLIYADERVKPAGLGARDSLRLEAGLCLYGHDMNDEIDPVAANILFSIGKQRRTDGGVVGADAVIDIINKGSKMRRVGLTFSGRMPVREGAEIVDNAGAKIGYVTSGTFSPCLELPICFAYVPAHLAENDTPITAMVRGKPVTGKVSPMPFVAQNYARKPGLNT